MLVFSANLDGFERAAGLHITDSANCKSFLDACRLKLKQLRVDNQADPVVAGEQLAVEMVQQGQQVVLVSIGQAQDHGGVIRAFRQVPSVLLMNSQIVTRRMPQVGACAFSINKEAKPVWPWESTLVTAELDGYVTMPAERAIQILNNSLNK